MAMENTIFFVVGLFVGATGIIAFYQFRDQSFKESLNTMKTLIQLEFERSASNIIEEQRKKLVECNHVDLGVLLDPFKEKLVDFSKTVEEKYSLEARERYSLRSKIEDLMQSSQKMTDETQALTRALRGDPKIQGNWGELTLERILEAAGLREGEEYRVQSAQRDTEGNRYQPDFVIHLPGGKHVVIDAKVSLKQYALFVASEDVSLQKQALLQHLKSLKRHIEELSAKHYSRLVDLNAPEVVFMFIPVESAYFAAIKEEAALVERAWKHNIALVTASTLMASLKTVAHLWMLERQNKNAKKIAEEAGKIYDKFSGFVEEFQKIGKVFDDGQKHFKVAMDRLTDGPGNVLRKLEDLKGLGVSPKKQLPIPWM